MNRIQRTSHLLRGGLVLLLAALALYTAAVVPDWAGHADDQRLALLGIVALAALLVTGLRRLPVYFLSAPLALAALGLMNVPGGGFAALVGLACLVLALAVTLLLRAPGRERLVNLALSLVTLAVLLVLLELAAPALTTLVQGMRRAAVLAAVAPPLDADHLAGEAQQPVSADRAPTAEYITRGPGPAWGELTGWGTDTDSVLHYSLDGVYDTLVEYNSLGFRGPEISTDKPDDVYRILITGDSFIEAREVAYEDTVYAQLAALLADAHTPDGKRIEVFGVGAVGWGSIQRYLYYHNEGLRYSPDLIIDCFFINDVADNNPHAFYPDRDLDFAVSEEGVQLLRDGVAVTEVPFNPALRWLDGLPGSLAGSNTARFLRELVAPQAAPITLAGPLGQAHPQNYIYVREPEVEGYPEGWRRTALAYAVWAREAAANGAQLMVLNIDITAERITELSTYFAELQDGWIWDVDLPHRRLSEILDPLGVPLLDTRAAYAAAAAPGQRAYDTLFFVEDGHWNPTGHRVTAEYLADSLRQMGVVAGG